IVRTNAIHWRRTLGMARVEVIKRYSGSLLGIFWGIVRPSLFIAVYWFAISIGLRGERLFGDTPFILWLAPGIIVWFFISDALTVGGSSIRKNSHLVTKMVFPVATIPTFTVLSLLVVHLMVLTVVVVIFLASGYGLSVYALQTAYYLLCAVSFSIVAATLLSTLTAVSRDVGHMIKSVMTVLFWLTPIIWPLDRLEGPVRYVIMLNPITYIVQGYRNSFVLDRWFYQQWEYGLYFWGVMLVLTLLTSYLFAKLKGEFADIL
ncbi:MAG: ABC transporter permease, partial [Actinomycetota bacterium]|nr:ABC transporter permease [Actinomycetota bacterium]